MQAARTRPALVALAHLMLGAGAMAAPGEAPPALAPASSWGRAVTGQDILTAAESALRDRVAGREGRLRMSALRTPDGVRVPVGELAMVPRLVALSAASSAASSTARVVVSLSVDGRPVRDIPVSFDAALWVPGAVASRDLAVGSVLTAADVGEGDVNALAGAALPSGALPGMRLRHRVAKARALTPDVVEAMPDVPRGGRVEVELAQGDVVLRASGVALSDAGVGERARIRLWRDQTVMATVVGVGRVSLAEGVRPWR